MYQPKIDCASKQPVGFEALVRWQHPVRGVVMPCDFVPLAESSGLINPLTMLVINTALAWFAAHFSEDDLQLSVNISACNLQNVTFADYVATLCNELGLPPNKLICELTETSTMADPVTSLDLLTRLRLKGFLLSIDDFGTGFSSMLQLVRLPFSEIKIDKSFVMTAMQSDESRAVIKSIVELGQSLGLRSSAEGVEDDETLGFLGEVGCELAQGYLIAPPMLAEEALGWYRSYVGAPGSRAACSSSARAE